MHHTTAPCYADVVNDTHPAGERKGNVPVLFHCTHTHKAEHCLLHDMEDTIHKVGAMNAAAKENNIKIVSVYSNDMSHTTFFIVDADSAEALNAYFKPLIPMGHIDVVPVYDDTAGFQPAR